MRAPLRSVTTVRPPRTPWEICMPLRLMDRMDPFGRTLAVPPPFNETVFPGGVWLPAAVRVLAAPGLPAVAPGLPAVAPGFPAVAPVLAPAPAPVRVPAVDPVRAPVVAPVRAPAAVPVWVPAPVPVCVPVVVRFVGDVLCVPVVG